MRCLLSALTVLTGSWDFKSGLPFHYSIQQLLMKFNTVSTYIVINSQQTTYVKIICNQNVNLFFAFVFLSESFFIFDFIIK